MTLVEELEEVKNAQGTLIRHASDLKREAITVAAKAEHLLVRLRDECPGAAPTVEPLLEQLSISVAKLIDVLQ